MASAKMRRLTYHLDVADAYLCDGARSSALAHIRAAKLITEGKSVPRGPNFWKLAVEPVATAKATVAQIKRRAS